MISSSSVIAPFVMAILWLVLNQISQQVYVHVEGMQSNICVEVEAQSAFLNKAEEVNATDLQSRS